MSEEEKNKIITCCNTISNEKNSLLKTKQVIKTTSDLCTKETISINNMNMKESIELLTMDIDKIINEINDYVKDIDEEIIIMNRVV